MPLPAPTEAAFYAAGPAGQEGPMTAQDLMNAVAAGRFSEDVQVWWPDAPGWVALDSQPELVAQLAALRGPAAAPGDGAAKVATAVPPASDDELDRIFAGLVRSSWKYHYLLEDTTRVDEVLVGALITSTLDTGRALIDLESDGTNHFLRFEDPADRSRITMAITHLTDDVTTAKAVGQRASVVIGYGEPIKSFAKVFGAMRQEAKSGYLGRAEPGVVSFDADGASHYLYAQVDLYLDLDEYIGEGFSVDHAKLASHVAATVHALRKFLLGKVSD